MPGNPDPLIVPADQEGIARAVAILRVGGLVALPTETVYGLAARADSVEAVARIYRAKGRPAVNPLIVHAVSLPAAERLARFDDVARDLAIRYWPGPLTLVLPRRADAMLTAAVTAGLPSVALRVPAHPVMQRVLVACEFPLAAPSANRSGGRQPDIGRSRRAEPGGSHRSHPRRGSMRTRHRIHDRGNTTGRCGRSAATRPDRVRRAKLIVGQDRSSGTDAAPLFARKAGANECR